MSAVRIVLKGVPPSLNKFAGRENSREYRAEKKQWTDAVQWYVKKVKDRPAAPFQKAKVFILYYFPTAARHDPDNYSGKFLLDGLTQAKVIRDDSFGCITLHLDGAVDRKNPRTVITVVEDTSDGNIQP